MKTIAILAAILLAGCSNPGPTLPPEWHGRDLNQPGWTNTTLPSENSLVLEYNLAAGAKLSWDWFTNDPGYLYFQVVKVEGKQTIKLVGKHSQDEVGHLNVPSSGVYQIIWMNDDPIRTTTFIWTASEGASQRNYGPGEGPGCLLLC